MTDFGIGTAPISTLTKKLSFSLKYFDYISISHITKYLRIIWAGVLLYVSANVLTLSSNRYAGCFRAGSGRPNGQ